MFDWPIIGIIGGIVSVLVGIVIIVWPRVIAYFIGGWLIVLGVLAILQFL